MTNIHQIQKEQREKIEITVKHLLSVVPSSRMPQLAVICGSGLSGLSETLKEPIVLDYKTIPNFSTNTVAGHSGKLVFGFLQNIPTVCMVGRFHFYEGHSLFNVTFPVRVFAKLGVKAMVVTNAAGGLNPNFNTGDIMIIKDHINMPGLAGNNPLIGVNHDDFGPRFPALTDAYDDEMSNIMQQSARKCGLTSNVIRSGVYCFVAGVKDLWFVDKAEARMLKSFGGDAVGMSTVPEVIIARHCGIRVVGLSLITNKVITEEKSDIPKPTHEEVLQASQNRARDMQGLVHEFAGLLKTQTFMM
ncbi:purine nucleoside phosphorylase-like protein [Rozella allomycis CSF55]|uniref:Purine nucleoside phosphorylase n=1 Tax=Rozella allomycis (strain CSF55) TaxID=988480 RepID=A0A075AQF2_ROZAC|nr:Nucleoside phosphorylase domain-containing protein [Rozella allomycis CSF55]RKP21894.1 purine nucleoside phosphorylase-like protein [Rozella allomycis CSF55]|eukprot:EPZ30827.1 Nucleoside phosphorylase domain-containing protein [Rozella allomycis CSF55]